MYLNTVPFVFRAYGIEAAALTYFGKHADELDVLEAATLVGMLKGPSSFNPVLNPERSQQRRNVVLANLVEEGHLSRAEMEVLREKPTPLAFRPTTRQGGIAPYFAEYVRRQLDIWAEENGYNLATSGLRIHTTLDADLQQAATAAFDRTLEDLQAVVDVSWSEPSVPFFSQRADAYAGYRGRGRAFDYFWDAHPHVLDRLIRKSERYAGLMGGGQGREQALERLRADEAFTDSLKASASVLQGGFVAIDPQDGHVKAWVGGRDFSESEFDHVAQARRQPGSTFKPFVYAAALANGYMPDDTLPDWPFHYINHATGQSWAPDNFGGASGSLFTLRQALAYSKNTITAQLVMRLGAKRVVDFAHRMGIRSELDPVPSIGLGTSPVSLLELTSAYSTIANLGKHQVPLVITRIENQDGDVIEEFAPSSRQAIPAPVAYAVLDMMRGVVDRGTGARIRTQYGARGDLAGKTGTTQRAADGWFMLLHPDLIMGSWVGFDVQELTFRTTWWGQGAHTALHTVGRFHDLVDLPAAEFQAPPDLVGGTTLAALLHERSGTENRDGRIPEPTDSDWAMASFETHGWTGPPPGTPGFDAVNWLNFRERQTSQVKGYLTRLRNARN
jgi:penicillin-binding protein 1A